jgi:peptidoglycan-N-acetylglucosamine deacetylase
MRRWLWWLVACLTLVGALIALWKLSNSRTFQVYGELVSSVPCTAPYVALSLDDGPNAAQTPPLLELLERHGANATFFLVGRELDRFPEAGQQIVRAGHELGNHGYTHTRMVFVSSDFIQSELASTDAAIIRAGHKGPIPFRPPYGKKLLGLPRYLGQTGRTTVMWNIEPESAPGVEQTPEGIARHTVEQARPGSIILLHAMHDTTGFKLRALDRMLSGLAQRGFRVVSYAKLTAVCSPQS